MWRMEIVSDDRIVAEHSNVTVVSKDLWIPNSRSVAQGYTACGPNGEATENVGGDHGEHSNIELTAEGLIVVKGLWAHYEDRGGAHHPESGYYFGVQARDGRLTKVNALPGGWDEPLLHREWIIRRTDSSGEPEVPPVMTAEEEPSLPLSDVAGKLGSSSRSII